MKAITAPINGNSPREVIANLQGTLQICLDRGAILGNDPNARQSLSQAFRPERERQSYGPQQLERSAFFKENETCNRAKWWTNPPPARLMLC
jgi:hypothetical protein